MNIKYYKVKNFIGWLKTEAFVQEIILNNNTKSILEIGAGANPTLNPEFITKHNLSYTISDKDNAELNKANPLYKKLILNLSDEIIELYPKYDLVFSRMVSEHIPNAKIFHKNVYNILNSGGISFHCFSTLYALPFLVNKILPDSISDLILGTIAPRDKHQHGKFKAHYDWSRGPSKKMIKKFENIGYEIIEYVGYFGHNYYLKIPVLNKIEEIKTTLLLKFPLPSMTAYAYFILRKP